MSEAYIEKCLSIMGSTVVQATKHEILDTLEKAATALYPSGMTFEQMQDFFSNSSKYIEEYGKKATAKQVKEDLLKVGGFSSKKKKRKPRGKSPYIFFSMEKRGEVKSKYPDYSFGEIGKELGKLWKAQSDKDKEKYELLASQERINLKYDSDNEIPVVKKKKRQKKKSSS